MLSRVSLQTPRDYNSWPIYNGNASKPFTKWEFFPKDLETAFYLYDRGCERPTTLGNVLRCVGSHSKLWIENWEGTIAPMDTPPEGWCYGNGKPVEQEWFWLWYPTTETAQKMTDLLNGDALELYGSNMPWKALVPFQSQRSMGQVSTIEAIPISRLPDLVKKDAEWVFEFER
jgi:hypothetical protein